MEANCSTPAMGECVEMLIAHKTSVVLVINILIVIVKIGMTKSIIQQCFCVLWLFKSVSSHFLWVPELLNFILRFSLALNRQETWKNSYWSILNKAKQVRMVSWFFLFCFFDWFFFLCFVFFCLVWVFVFVFVQETCGGEDRGNQQDMFSQVKKEWKKTWTSLQLTGS